MALTIFISYTSNLQSACGRVDEILRTNGHSVAHMSIFPRYGQEIVHELRAQIRKCDVVIQLVGFRYGGEPTVVDAAYGRVSYTQLEAQLAREAKVPVYYIPLREEFPVDRLEAGQSEQESDVLRELQSRYREAVQAQEVLRADPVATMTELENRVLKLPLDGIAKERERLRANGVWPGATQALEGGGWRVLPPHRSTPRQVEYSAMITAAVSEMRERTRDAAYLQAIQNIQNTMGALTERFGAASSYLFIRDNPGGPGPFWINPGDPIRSLAEHNTGIASTAQRPKAATIWGNGITGYVAATGRPYLAPNLDVSAGGGDKHYMSSAERTKSEIAVPILHFNGKDRRVIGVCNFESEHVNGFLASHLGELLSAATKLAVDILIVQHLVANPRAFGWHPDLSGWTPKRLFDDFCTAVAYTAPSKPWREPSQEPFPDATAWLPRPSCTIWYGERDRDRSELHVRSTARFDYEYIAREWLPADRSFTGIAFASAKGTVLFGKPEEIASFQRKEKSKDMGMAHVVATPIYVPSAPEPVGTLNFAFFSGELTAEQKAEVAARFPEHLAADLAGQLGELISHYRALRIDCAAAHLRYRMHEHMLPGLTGFETVRDVIMECLDAHCCSIFARDFEVVLDDRGRLQFVPRNTLSGVATTGLLDEDGSPVAIGDAVYRLGENGDGGLTSALGESSGRVYRVRSVVAPNTRAVRLRTPGSPEEGSATPAAADARDLLPRNRYRESFSHSDTEHRPFVGVSVDDPRLSDEGEPKRSWPAGVFRVLRASGSKPFVASDVELLQMFGRAIHGLFLRWNASRLANTQSAFRLGRRFPFAQKVFGAAGLPKPKVDAVCRLGADFLAGSVWNRRQVESVLIDLVTVFRLPDWRVGKCGGVITSLRLKSPVEGKPEEDQLLLYCIHRLGIDEPLVEENRKEFEKHRASVGLSCFPPGGGAHPATFGRECKIYRPIKYPECARVESGVCMPVRFVTRNGVSWGVLSLDRDDVGLPGWSTEALEVVALAAKKLDFIGRDNCSRDAVIYQSPRWREAFTHFFAQALRRVGVWFWDVRRGLRKTKRLVVWGDSSAELVLRERLQGIVRGRFPGDPLIGWNMRGGFEIPLWYGPFKPVAEEELTLVGCLDPTTMEAIAKQGDDPADAMRLKIVEVIHVWNRFVSSQEQSTLSPLFQLSFTKQPWATGDLEHLTHWLPALTLAPDIFPQNPYTIAGPQD